MLFNKNRSCDKKLKKELLSKPIAWLLIAGAIWLLLGLLLGIFYDFFFLFGGTATFNNQTGELIGKYSVFNPKIYVANPHFYSTQLSVLHTHTLLLGFVMHMIFICLEKCFLISQRRKWFIASFAIYNIGLFLVIVFMMIRGIDWVLNINYILVKNIEYTNENGQMIETQKFYYTFQIVDTIPYKTIPSFATAIPHIIMGAGFVLMIHEISKALFVYLRNRKMNKENIDYEY
ncbi:DUF2871 family protein [Malacoplasma muris]|uniref:DUF2871 family protein n=1 Tax=Malacoplasma muris TaxID=2119 RepID=UPI00398EBCB0